MSPPTPARGERNGLAGSRELSESELAQRLGVSLGGAMRLLPQRGDSLGPASEELLDCCNAAVEELIERLGLLDGELECFGRGAEDRHAISALAAGTRSGVGETDPKAQLLGAPPKGGLVAPDSELEVLLVGDDHAHRPFGFAKNHVASFLTGHNCLSFQDSLTFRSGLQE